MIPIVRYKAATGVGWGVLTDGKISPLVGDYPTTGDFISAGVGSAREAAVSGAAPSLDAREVEILSPITRNQQFLAQTLNYESHILESGMNPENIVFNVMIRKASSSISPPNTDIVRPAGVQLLDYEVELGLVIAQEITEPVSVTDANLLDYLAAVVIVNDVSARDIQLPYQQYYQSKSYRTFGPVGPLLCLLDPPDAARLADLRMTLDVNGKTRQDSNTGEMLFPPARTISDVSGFQDLFPGDLITTGTAGGVTLQAPKDESSKMFPLLPPATQQEILRASHKLYLQPGDTIDTQICSGDGLLDLGRQENLIVAEERVQ